MNLLNAIFSVGFLFSVIRMTTPILYGSMSSIMAEYCGISNIGIEGIMLTCAVTGAVVSYWFGANAWIGLLAALLIGTALGLLLGYIVMKLKVDPTIAGIAYNLTAAGATVFFLYLVCGEKGNSSSITSGTLPTVNLPIIQDIPLIGAIFSGHNLLTYVAFLLVPVLSFVLYQTRFGLHVRSVGENDEAVESVGIYASKTRYWALACSGFFAALGGAYLSMGYVSYFVRDMVAGRGFIALAACALGNKRPASVLLACILFGLTDAFATNPATQNIGIATELVGTLPYIITIIALVIYSYMKMKEKEKIARKQAAAVAK